jgi:hypothetical protein
MPLPKLVTPEYDLTLPCTKEKIKYRPFLVKEEKILIMAMESEDEKQIINAVKTIIKNCTTLKKKVEDLPTFEIEYLFLKIRSKSVGEISNITLICPDDEETEVSVEINLDEVEVTIPKEHTTNIKVNDSVGVIMKYPSLDTFVKNNFNTESPNIETAFELASSCVEQIYEGEDVWESKDVTKKELMDFIESMDNKQFTKIQQFFDTMPKLEKVVSVTNPKTGIESEVKIEGLASFFA